MWERIWPGWIDRNLSIVLGARFAMSGARALTGVVTAIYLSALGFSGLELGLLFLCVALASALLSTTIGLISDRTGRRPFLVGVPLLTAVAALAFALFRNPAVLFVFASLGSFGRGGGAGGGSVGPYQPAESAFVGEIVPAWARTVAFGRMSFCSSLGALGGGLLAGLAQPRPGLDAAGVTAAYRPAFVATAILAAVAGIAALWLRRPVDVHQAPPRRRRGIAWPRRSWPALWRFWAANGVNGIAIGMFGPFLSYWLHRRYGVSPGGIGIVFAIANVAALASALSAAGIARRLGTIRAIATVRILGGLLLVPLALAPTFPIAGALYVLRMLTQRVGLPLRQSLVQDLADPEERASLAALSNLPAQGTQAGSQVLAGYLFDEVALALPFEIAAGLQCLNGVLYGLLFGRFRPPPARTRDTLKDVD
ncbi:MAG: MFS transporter [Candidatus Dormibacteraceae bacterium]